MADVIMHSIAEYYRTRHALVLKVVDGLDDQQMVWRPNGTTPCIGFHVWHLARWADYAQAMFAGTGVQIWEEEELAKQWGFANANLGFAETGLGMHDDVLAALQFPGKEVLLGYARQAFSEADRAVGAIGDDQFHRRVRDSHGVEGEELAVGDAVLNWLVHDSRHLGMIECLLGVQGLHGTATRQQPTSANPLAQKGLSPLSRSGNKRLFEKSFFKEVSMRRWILVVTSSFVVFSFAACTSIGLPMLSPPTPDARATEARIAMNIFATLTASAPTASSTRAITITPPRVNTPIVKNTPRPAATRAPTNTPRPAPPPTLIPPPTVDLFADKSVPGPIAKNALTNLEGKWEITYVGDFRDKTVFNDSPGLDKTALGVWVTAQFRIRNLQPAASYLGGDYRFTAIDQDGKPHDEDSDASRNAGWQYCGCDDAYDNVQPGQDTVIVVTFDVPEATKTLTIALRQGWISQLMTSPRFRIANVDQIPAWKPKK